MGKRPELGLLSDALPESPRALPKLYSRYKPPPQVHAAIGDGPGADQSFKDEVDINNIMKRARQTGVLIDPMQLARATRIARYEDVSQVPEDFFQAQLFVQEATSAFDKLPSAVRARFQNNVKAMLEFLADDKNRDEAIKLGLVEPKKAEEVKTPPVPPAPPPAGGA